MIETLSPLCLPTRSEESANAQANIFKALSDPTRLRILHLLLRHQGEGDLCVAEITARFTLEQPTISYHLRTLRYAGLIGCRKEGLWTYYYVRPEALSQVREAIEQLESLYARSKEQ